MFGLTLKNQLCLGSRIRGLVIPADPTLVGYWKLNDGPGSGTLTTDSSGSNNNGTLSDAGMWSPTGIEGACLSFDPAIPQFVSINTFTNLDLHDALTIACWAKPTDGASTQTLIFGDFAGNGSPLFNLTINQVAARSLRFEYWTSPGTTVRKDTLINAWTLNAWHHFMASKDSGGNIKLYIDGSVINTGTSSGTPGSADADPIDTLTFGRAGGFDGQYYSGLLDNIRIYNRQLSDPEVLALYNGNL